MTSARLWYEGARPKTLGVAVSCVVVGTAAGSLDGAVNWPRAIGALVVSIALQVGVNYANDYSDGVRGTDAERRGPVRLTATGLATPSAVKRAAALSFAVAAIVGGVLALVTSLWLVVVGLACIAAAVLYTGGPKPYGYFGLGEAMVFVFFGLVGTVGSAYLQHQTIPGVTWPAAVVVGLPACAILLANNIRDIETDTVSGKRTVAVRVGSSGARMLYAAFVAGALVAVVVCALFEPLALLALLATPLAIAPIRLVRTRHDPPGLVAALIRTARFQLVLSALLAIGLWLS